MGRSLWILNKLNLHILWKIWIYKFINLWKKITRHKIIKSRFAILTILLFMQWKISLSLSLFFIIVSRKLIEHSILWAISSAQFCRSNFANCWISGPWYNFTVASVSMNFWNNSDYPSQPRYIFLSYIYESHCSFYIFTWKSWIWEWVNFYK